VPTSRPRSKPSPMPSWSHSSLLRNVQREAMRGPWTRAGKELAGGPFRTLAQRTSRAKIAGKSLELARTKNLLRPGRTDPSCPTFRRSDRPCRILPSDLRPAPADHDLRSDRRSEAGAFPGAHVRAARLPWAAMTINRCPAGRDGHAATAGPGSGAPSSAPSRAGR
jgi:hypothetical protein